MLDTKTLKIIEKMQRAEMTEYYVYTSIAGRIKEKSNVDIILQIAEDEKRHAEIWSKYTGKEAKAYPIKKFVYCMLNRIFGFTFTLKLMERGEIDASDVYDSIKDDVPEARLIADEEEAHENELLQMLDEDRLQYVGSMVLGLNDALVELTGTLAGLTFALQNTKLIALSGVVTGISATLSMASSEYLSARSENSEHPFKAATYTGIMYIIAVVLMVTPYLVFDSSHYMYAVISMLMVVVLIILIFTYYVAVAQDLDFKKRFLEMITISLSVALISFVIGVIVKNLLGIDV